MTTIFIVKANKDISAFDSLEKAKKQLSEMCFHKPWCPAEWVGHEFNCECGLIEGGEIIEVELNVEF